MSVDIKITFSRLYFFFLLVASTHQRLDKKRLRWKMIIVTIKHSPKKSQKICTPWTPGMGAFE